MLVCAFISVSIYINLSIYIYKYKLSKSINVASIGFYYSYNPDSCIYIVHVEIPIDCYSQHVLRAKCFSYIAGLQSSANFPSEK